MSNLLGRYVWYSDMKDGKACQVKAEVVGYSMKEHQLYLFVQPLDCRNAKIEMVHFSRVEASDKARKIFEIVT